MGYVIKHDLTGRRFNDTYLAMSQLGRVLFWIALLNFVTFVLIAFVLGGDAINGKDLDGHYYLMSHGHYTEVSKQVFAYSFFHALSQFVTMPLAVIALMRARYRAWRREREGAPTLESSP